LLSKTTASFGVFVLILSVIVFSGCQIIPVAALQKPSNSFGFAIIADPHIGYGIPNYYPDDQQRMPNTDWLDDVDEGNPGNPPRDCDESIKKDQKE